MATKHISELEPAAPLTGDELMPVSQTGLTRQVTLHQFAELAPPGPAGPPGPPGPTGEAGISQGQYAYRWKTDTTISDPGHGFIEADAADATTYTTLCVSTYTITEQAVIELTRLDAGDTVYLYEYGEIATWNRYELTETPINQGSEWFEIPVAYAATGPAPFVPANNSRIDLVLPVTGGPGPPGPSGSAGADSTVPGPAGPAGPAGPSAVINTDGDPGTTIYVGTTDPDVAHDLLPGDVWMDTSP